MTRKLLAAICVAATLGGTVLSAQDANRTLITNALEETDIFSDRQFVLDATISVSNKKNRSEGTYQLIWLGSEQWREHIQVGPENVTRIGAKGTVYERASSPTAEETLLIFSKLFRFRAELEFPLQRNSRLKAKKVKQIRRVIFDSDGGTTSRYISFEPDHLVGFSNFGMHGDGSFWLEIPEFQQLEDYRPALGKQFPFKISTEYRGSSFVASLQSIKAVNADSIDSAIFATDESFRKTNSCFAPTPEDKIKAEPLHIPFQRLRGNDHPGYPSSAVSVPDAAGNVSSLDPRWDPVTAVLFATISDKGTVSTRVLSAPSIFDTALEDAIRQSKYEPPLCNGQPASYSTIFEVRFKSFSRSP